MIGCSPHTFQPKVSVSSDDRARQGHRGITWVVGLSGRMIAKRLSVILHNCVAIAPQHRARPISWGGFVRGTRHRAKMWRIFPNLFLRVIFRYSWHNKFGSSNFDFMGTLMWRAQPLSAKVEKKHNHLHELTSSMLRVGRNAWIDPVTRFVS